MIASVVSFQPLANVGRVPGFWVRCRTHPYLSRLLAKIPALVPTLAGTSAHRLEEENMLGSASVSGGKHRGFWGSDNIRGPEYART